MQTLKLQNENYRIFLTSTMILIETPRVQTFVLGLKHSGLDWEHGLTPCISIEQASSVRLAYLARLRISWWGGGRRWGGRGGREGGGREGKGVRRLSGQCTVTYSDADFQVWGPAEEQLSKIYLHMPELATKKEHNCYWSSVVLLAFNLRVLALMLLTLF